MKSKVYFIDLKSSYKENFLSKLNKLINTAGMEDIVQPRSLVAIKLHFGEFGNTAFIRPVFIRKLVDTITAAEGIPFLTDTNTLYAGQRCNTPRHITTAVQNGFAFSVVNAPIVIADGLKGKNDIAVEIHQKNFKNVYIASDIVEADVLVSVAHFKGHELCGFGGTLKNIGMGCASRKGKLEQHSTVRPKVKRKRCIACGDCIERCSQNAISMVDEKAFINEDVCIGCGECIITCAQEAVKVQWNQSGPVFLEKMVEYTLGVVKGRKERALFVNFITDVSPACDCVPFNDSAIVGDIGVVASKDPVAIDQASVDLVNQSPALPGSCIAEDSASPGKDKFKAVYPDVDWEVQLEYAQKLGLGSREYDLEKI
jgi:uncharacterized Fe-S center protein